MYVAYIYIACRQIEMFQFFYSKYLVLIGMRNSDKNMHYAWVSVFNYFRFSPMTLNRQTAKCCLLFMIFFVTDLWDVFPHVKISPKSVYHKLSNSNYIVGAQYLQ